MDGQRKDKKGYWGEVSSHHNAADILEIMKYGGKGSVFFIMAINLLRVASY